MKRDRVVVVGAGIGGLVAALLLATNGCEVVVLEMAATPGGKCREVSVGDARIDAGPTVLTMRGVFDEIFAEAGSSLTTHLTLRPAEVLARHAWSATECLDLYGDVERSADAIGVLAGATEAAGYRAFAARARDIFETLDKPFMRAQRPRVDQLVTRFGFSGLGRLRRISPFATMWSALREHFEDPRLLQLFGRYATYCGSSPFLAPATLMLVAHAEQQGVWLVEGGMHRLAAAIAQLVIAKGGTIRYGARVREIDVAGGRATAVTLDDGERIAADAVVLNADAAALSQGLFGSAVVRAAPRVAAAQRSLSAVTFAVRAPTRGFPLARHNVFFSRDYAGEFAAIGDGRMPADPTVYVCAQDRGDLDEPSGAERLLCLVNAPATGDTHPLSAEEIERCEQRTFDRLTQCGLTVERTAEAVVTTDPAQFDRLFPGTGGALYGPASHGWQASFARAGSRGLPGLYLAGGSVHPGPGLPMAALSGRLAAEAILADWASTRRSRRTAMPGGTSTRSAPTAPTR